MLANLTDILQKVLKSLKYSGHPPKYMSKGWAKHYTGFNDTYFDKLVSLGLIKQYPIKDLLFPDGERNSHVMYSRKQLDSLDESLDKKISIIVAQLERV